jgi:hypothetical protein
MGHCYRKTGATGTTGEQQFATDVANFAMIHIHGKGGWTVRPILADAASSQYRGDAMAAVHCDGSTHTTARGASAGYTTPEGQAFAQAWKTAYASRGWTGGFRPDNYTAALQGYYGTRKAKEQGNRAAFILEAGFLTNSADRALLKGAGGAERVALALADAMGISQAPQLPEAPEFLEDPRMVRLVHGNNRDIIPGSTSTQNPNGVAYGDLVFMIMVDPATGDVTRRYIPAGALFTLLVKTVGVPIEVRQQEVDAVYWPNAENEAPAYLR